MIRKGYRRKCKLREACLEAIDKPGDPPDLTARLFESMPLQAVYVNKVRDADQRVGNFQSAAQLGTL